MKKTIICFLSVCLLIFNFNIVHSQEMILSGESYILIDEESGRILNSHNKDKIMPMASTTKIMTALVALENGNLNDEVLIEKESTDIEGSSIYLKEKETILLKDLLYGLMLRSGNDAAVAISNHISKSENEFVKMMNIKAKSIGANNTNFVNPHGLNHEDHYSTAYDLALITKEAFKNKVFKEIVSTKTYKANRKENYYFVNKNKTLWDYNDGDGVKTGYTMRSGRCLVSSAEKYNMRLIAVSLNARDWFNDNYKLFNYGFDNFRQKLIYDKNHFLKKIPIENSKEELEVITKNDFIYPLNKDEEEGKIKVKLNINTNLNPPIKKDSVVGTIDTYLNGVLIKRDDLIGANNVNPLNIFQKIFKGKKDSNL